MDCFGGAISVKGIKCAFEYPYHELKKVKKIRMIKTFDFFRVIGALMIFICHFWTKPWFGEVGVSLFFVLSGYCIAFGNYKKVINIPQFLKKRILKLYPLYFIMLLFCFICSFLIWPTSHPFQAFFSQAFLTQTLYPTGPILEFNAASWYVSTLIWLYVFYIALNWLINKSNKLFFILILVLMLCLIFLKFNNYINFNKLWFFYFSPYGRFLDFSIGCIFAIFFKKIQNQQNIILKYNYLEILTVSILSIYFIIDPQLHYVSFVLPIIWGFTFLVFSFEKGWLSKFMTLKFFTICSKYSYCFYIIHYIIIKLMLGIWSYFNINNIISYSQYGILVLILTILFTVISHKIDTLTNKLITKI